MSVKKFLSSVKPGKWSGGHPCTTCRHPRSKEIEKACVAFDKERAARRTRMPWSVLVRDYLRTEFDFQHDTRSLMRHMEKCLGKKPS